MFRAPPTGTLAAMNPQLRAGIVVAAALLAAACGSPSASGGSPASGANSPSAVGYSRCMRSHGVPNFPDPDSSGQIQKVTGQQVGVSETVLDSARTACQSLWPYQSEQQGPPQSVSDDLKFARCMRAAGLPKFPDPTSGSHGAYFDISVSADGFDPHSPQILAKANSCQHVLPAGSRLPSVTVSP